MTASRLLRFTNNFTASITGRRERQSGASAPRTRRCIAYCLSQQLPGTQQDTGCHLQMIHHAITSHHLVTWCALNSDILTTLYFIYVCRKLHCKSSAVYNFNLLFYHLSHVDPTRPDPATLANFLTRSYPTRPVARVNSRTTLVAPTGRKPAKSASE